jgi:hypothetical protein
MLPPYSLRRCCHHSAKPAWSSFPSRNATTQPISRSAYCIPSGTIATSILDDAAAHAVEPLLNVRDYGRPQLAPDILKMGLRDRAG